MTIESKIEAAQKLIEEVKAEMFAMRAEKAAPPRNWPERIEAGMCFRHIYGIVYFVYLDSRADFGLMGVIGVGKIRTTGTIKWLQKDRDDFEYLGFDALTIRTEAHEPTGAELVGKACMYSNNGAVWLGPEVMESYLNGKGYSWGSHVTWYKFARLAR